MKFEHVWECQDFHYAHMCTLCTMVLALLAFDLASIVGSLTSDNFTFKRKLQSDPELLGISAAADFPYVVIHPVLLDIFHYPGT